MKNKELYDIEKVEVGNKNITLHFKYDYNVPSFIKWLEEVG